MFPGLFIISVALHSYVHICGCKLLFQSLWDAFKNKAFHQSAYPEILGGQSDGVHSHAYDGVLRQLSPEVGQKPRIAVVILVLELHQNRGFTIALLEPAFMGTDWDPEATETT